MHRKRLSVVLAAALAATTIAAPAVRAADPVIIGCIPGLATIGSSTPALSIPQGATATFQVSIDRDADCTSSLVVEVYGSPPPGSTVVVQTSPTTGSAVQVLVKTSNVLPNVSPKGQYPLFIYVHPDGAYHQTYLPLSLTVTASTAPISGTPTARLTTGATIGSSTVPVRIAWPAAIDPDGIKSYGLQRQVNGGGWSNVTLPSATSTSITQSLTYGTTYRYRVRAIDKLGHAGAYVYGRAFSPKLIQQTSTFITTDELWKTVYTSLASGGSYKYLTYDNAEFSFTTTALSVGFVSIKGPTRTNDVAVTIDGGFAADASAHASTVAYRRLIYVRNNATSASHTYRFRNAGTIGTTRFDLDAIVLLIAK